MSSDTKTILVIDNDLKSLNNVKFMLQDNDYNVITAMDGKSGWKIIRESPPDLVVLDILIPKINGYELSRLIKNGDEGRKIPIICYTSLPHHRYGASGENVKDKDYLLADAVLEKPLDFNKIAAATNSLLNGKRNTASDIKDKVLIIDDAPEVTELLSLRLQENYEINGVSSGEEALDMIERFEPDVILLDIQMPRVDGLTILKLIRSRYDSICIIMITAHGSEETAIEAMKNGADDYLIKPIDYRKIEKIVGDNLN